MLDLVPILAATAAEASGNPVSDLAGKFHIETRLIVAQAINFALVAALLWKFAYKPVMQTLQERRAKIADGLQYAEEMKAKLAETEKQTQEEIRKAQQQGGEIIAEAKQSAKDLLERETKAATARVEELIAKGREANELERQKMLSEVRQEIARLVVQTSGKVLQRELSADDRQRLTESAAKEMSSLN